MGKYRKPLGELRSFGKKFEGILALLPLLEKLDTLENEEQEKTKLVAQLKEEVEQQKLKNLQLKDIWTAAQDKAQTLLGEAEAQAAIILDRAAQQNATAQQDAVKSTVALKNDLNHEVDNLRKQITTAQKRLSKLDTELETKEQTLAVADSELERLRELL
jgi:chromosome segregation ATPase